MMGDDLRGKDKAPCARAPLGEEQLTRPQGKQGQSIREHGLDRMNRSGRGSLFSKPNFSKPMQAREIGT